MIDGLKFRVREDVAVGTIPVYHYTRKTLAELIKKKFNTLDIAFGQLKVKANLIYHAGRY